MTLKSRLDMAMVERGLVESRSKAQALIMARRVRVDGEYETKAGTRTDAESEIEVVELEHPWVGRGGMKLARAIEEFGIELTGLICADLGASTGGFTDVMLFHGARRVYAIDVGHGQLDVKLREDPRVVNMERFNVRYMEDSDLPEPVDFISIDVSFISLTMILPPSLTILKPDGSLVALIKPQFEVGKRDVGKGGIVRDEEKRRQVVEAITGFAGSQGLEVAGVIESPVKGAEGNVEFLMFCRRSGLSER